MYYDETIEINFKIPDFLRKRFYKELVNGRYEVILKKSYNKLKSN